MDLKEYIKQYIRELLDEESSSGDAGAYSTPFAFSKKKQKKTAEQWGMKLAPEGMPSDSKVMDYKNLTGQKKKKYKLYKEGEEGKFKVIFYDNYDDVPVNQIFNSWKEADDFACSGEWVENIEKYDPVKEDYVFKDVTRYFNPEDKQNYNGYTIEKVELEESNYDKASPYTAASDYGKESGYTGVGKDNHPNEYYGEKTEAKLMELIKKELLNEVSYSKFKTEIKNRTKSEALYKAIREVKRKLNEVDRLIEYTSRLKQELNEDEEGMKYWKRSINAINKISEVSNKISNKIKDIYQ